jgi:serine phosphatase RsbU (regulator of sigma subunit)
MKPTTKWICALVVFFTLGISVSKSQERVIDSLRKVVKTAKEDTNKIYSLKALAFGIYNYNIDTALILDSELVKLCQGLSSSPDKAVAKCARRNEGAAYCYAAIFYQDKGNYNKAVDYNNRALAIFNEVGYQQGISNVYNTFGIIYKEEGDYAKAMDNFFKALEINEKLGNKNLIGNALGNIGVIYNKLGEYDKALDYYNKALQISQETNDKVSEARNLDNMGTVYEAKNDYAKALDIYLKTEKISEEIDDENGMTTELLNIGSAYSSIAQQGKVSKAHRDSLMKKSMEYTANSLQIARKLGIKATMSIDLVNLGSDLDYFGKREEAEKDMFEAIAISDSIGAMDTKSGCYQMLSDIYTSAGDYKKALEAYKKYSALKDTIFNTDKNKEITRNEMTHEFDKKEATIKAEQDRKDVIAAEEKKKQQIIEYAISAGLILVLMLAAFIFRGYKQKQKANQLLEDKNRTIEEQKAKVDQAFGQLNEKHKEITDSINYAKRIQTALFKDEEYVSRHLPEHYILFKPRDVVSGDFYWGFAKGDKWYVAAVDCTGHGVPGAFLTMLGSAFLNEICAQPTDISPAEVLNQLRGKVVKELSAQGEVKDGMDISLCCIPLGSAESVKVEWAGANNPLWYTQNGEMKEIVADKQPIGYYESQKPFTNHILQLNKGDMIYLFTDGYADQFGGDRGKKYKYKQLSDKLKEIYNKPMEEQKKLLNKDFETWKGSLDQTDDVCVIGIRI